MVMPIKRVLFPPDNSLGKKTEPGDDIKAVKRAVSRAGFWPWQEFDKKYWNQFAHGKKNKFGVKIKGSEGVEGLAKSLGIRNNKGVWTPELHYKSQTAVVPKGKPHAGEPIWDQFSINLYRGYEDLQPAAQKVFDIFKWWDWLVMREPSYHYSQQRPIPIIALRKSPPNMPNTGDCSGTFISCAWLAGALSPDHFFSYTGYGNTDSLIRSGIPISQSEIDKYSKNHYVGVFYGNSLWDTDHVVAAKNSTTFYSHGKEAGPEIVRNINYHSKPIIGIRAYKVI